MKYVCTKDNITIFESYKIRNVEEMIDTLKEIKNNHNYKRTLKSWIKEWKAHNQLYDWGLFISHTKDVDLNEDEPRWKLICYEVLSFIYDLKRRCSK